MNIKISFLISALIHAGVIFAFTGFLKPKEVKTQMLVLQIEGVVSTKQVEQKVAGEQQPPPPPPPKPKPKATPKPTPPKNERPSDIKKPEPKPHQEEVAKQEEQENQPQNAKSDDTNQKAQSIDKKFEEQNILAQYVAKMKKRISSNIVYPLEAKRKDYVGLPKVKFTIFEDGSISPVTITVSGGHAILDEAAKDAIIKSAPFEKPPRVLHDVVIDIYFKRDDKKNQFRQ
ncbi:MAG: TonB family protein [Campylobacteraceae bacterium]|jgi:protein TonB|nr:TonB family protein [Campylobacteraceae bacterium]